MERPLDIEAWATAYIAVHEVGAHLDETHPDFLAAYYFLDALAGPRVEECWQGIVAVVNKRPSDLVLGMLAAGPMEDLLMHAGSEFIGRIELEAGRNPDFRRMLQGVWESGAPEVWARFERARSPSARGQ